MNLALLWLIHKFLRVHGSKSPLAFLSLGQALSAGVTRFMSNAYPDEWIKNAPCQHEKEIADKVCEILYSTDWGKQYVEAISNGRLTPEIAGDEALLVMRIMPPPLAPEAMNALKARIVAQMKAEKDGSEPLN